MKWKEALKSSKNSINILKNILLYSNKKSKILNEVFELLKFMIVLPNKKFEIGS